MASFYRRGDGHGWSTWSRHLPSCSTQHQYASISHVISPTAMINKRVTICNYFFFRSYTPSVEFSHDRIDADDVWWMDEARGCVGYCTNRCTSTGFWCSLKKKSRSRSVEGSALWRYIFCTSKRNRFREGSLFWSIRRMRLDLGSMSCPRSCWYVFNQSYTQLFPSTVQYIQKNYRAQNE